MFDGIYGYFFGDNSAQSTGSAANEKNANDWILVDQMSGRSSPVMVADLEMEELNDEDINSVAGDKDQQMNRQRLRKMRKEIANQAKKQQAREIIQRRQEIEKKLFEDSSSAESTSSSPAASTPPMPKHLDTVKPTIPRKKKCANIKQPKGAKGDNRKPIGK